MDKLLKKRNLCLFFIYCFILPLSYGLRIASWNVKDYGLFDRRIDDSFLTHYPKPEKEKQALRNVIHQVKADVLLLQEIGGLDFLKELQADLKAEGTDYPYSDCLKAADEQRQTAILSKKPFQSRLLKTDLHYHTGSNQTFSVLRGLLGISIELDSQKTLTLYNLHLKSKRESDKQTHSDERRRAEALVIRNELNKIHPPESEALYLIAGDFNDAYRKPAVQLFLKKNDQPLTYLLPISDSRGENWTHTYRYEDTYTRIDHFLISPALKPLISPFKGNIADTPDVLIASDHRLIYLDILPPSSLK